MAELLNQKTDMDPMSRALSEDPFSMDKAEKKAFLRERLFELTNKHYKGCDAYKRMLDVQGFDPSDIVDPAEIPFLPVRLFKELDLLSVPKEEIAANDYDLTVNKYRKVEYAPVEYPPTEQIIAELHELEMEITAGLAELEEML